MNVNEITEEERKRLIETAEEFGTVTIDGWSYTAAAARKLLAGGGEFQREREADERLALRQVEEEEKRKEAARQYGPWLEAWDRARVDLEEQEKQAMAELEQAVQADPVHQAFAKVAALRRARDDGRQIAGDLSRRVKGHQPLSGGIYESPKFEDVVNKILGAESKEVRKGILKAAMAKAGLT